MIVIDAVNTNASLDGPDGLTMGDLQDGGTIIAFNFLATGQGYAAAR